MTRYSSIRNLDWTLLAFVLAIATLGVLQIYSATRNTVWRGAHTKQIVYILAGMALMWLISQIDYHALLDRVPLLYLLSVLGLVVVYAIGDVRRGSKRWIALGSFNFQVSEFVKLVLILLVARYFSEVRRDTVSGSDLLKIGGLVGLPILLVMKQPDLGTALTYVPIAAGGVLLAGLRWKHLAVLAVAGALVVPVWWTHVAKSYQKERVMTFVVPDRDPRGSGYQLIQSRIAVGAGGLWGKGIAKGSQTQLRFLPVPHTDFIFSAYAEEHGFTGVLLALALYFVVLMRIIYNAQTAADRAGSFLCVCVCALLLFHLLVNVGMVIGRMPVTGIPLPLMSYGGSSMLAVFLMLGLVNNVRLRRFVN